MPVRWEDSIVQDIVTENENQKVHDNADIDEDL